MKLLSVGFGNTVAASRILAVISADAAPTKRMIQSARDGNTVIDATAGRKTRAVLVMDTGYVVLSALQPETLSARLATDESIMREANHED